MCGIGVRNVPGVVSAGPVEVPPAGFVPREGLAEILAGVLAGIDMGAWERRVAAWLAAAVHEEEAELAEAIRATRVPGVMRSPRRRP